MQVVLTYWALKSYQDLRARNQVTEEEFWDLIRPDVELLKEGPTAVKFSNSHFWGPAQDRRGHTMAACWKMKWHNLGPGRIQLRLGIVIHSDTAYICHGWVKSSDFDDKRQCAILKNHRDLIVDGHAQVVGRL